MLKSNITNLQFILDNKPQYSISFDKQLEKTGFSVFRFFGLVWHRNRNRTELPNFTELETETEPKNRTTDFSVQFRIGSVQCLVFGEKTPRVRLFLHPRFRVHSSCPPFPCACVCSHAVQRRRVHPAWLPVGSPEARPGNTMISATVACLPAGHPAGHASLHQLASRCCLCLCVVTLTPVPVNVHHIQYCTAGAAAQTRIQFMYSRQSQNIYFFRFLKNNFNKIYIKKY